MTKKQLHALKHLPMSPSMFRTMYGNTVVNNLWRKGLIRNTHNQETGVILYELTEKGKEVLNVQQY